MEKLSKRTDIPREYINVNVDALIYDEKDSVEEKINILKKGAKSRKLHDVKFRLQQLKKLRASFIKYELEVNYSNYVDLGLSQFSSFMGTFATIKNDLDETIDKLYEWTSPRYVDTPALLAPAKSYVIPEPFGICLVMSAWNSQFLTLIMPIAQAIAAGNVILAKPSEMAEVSAVICAKILSELDPEIIQIVQGGAAICEEILKNKMDIIVFTGSPQKGVLIARAAAEFLTPCILELGGQNPVIVDKSANLKTAATNIINGRYFVTGQICIAPEYVLVEREIYEKFKVELKTTLESFFTKDPKNSKDFSRMINKFHTERVSKLLNNNDGVLLSGGKFDIEEKYIEPTIFSYDSLKLLGRSSLACGEIFGPVLYLAPYDDIDDVIEYINMKEKPLVIYYFGNDKINKDKIIKNTSSGAFSVNDCIMHFTNTSLPFGGVGQSGYSAYHGIWGFNNLSHLKPVLDTPGYLISIRYPPYDTTRQKILTFLLKNVTFTQAKLVKVVLFTVLIIVLFTFRKSMGNIFKGMIYSYNNQ